MNRRSFLATLIAGSLAGNSASFAQNRRRKLLVRSLWQTVNIGDIAHGPGMLQLLAEQLPDVDLVLWPSKTDRGVAEMLAKNFPKAQVVEGSVDKTTGEPSSEGLRRAFAECDFFLHGSGPGLVAIAHLAGWAKKTGKPYGIYAVTLSEKEATTHRALLDEAKFLFTRDTISLEVARKAGLKAPVMDFAPDGAFAFRLRDDATALAYLREQELEEGKFLCVLPRLRYSQYWLIHNHPMTAEDRRKAQVNEEWKERDHSKLRDAMIAFVRGGHGKVLACPEMTDQVEVARDLLVNPLPEDVKKHVVWRDRYWRPDEAASVYARAMGMVSLEQHSPIFAIVAGVPAIHLRQSTATSKGQMWRDIGLSDWIFEMDEEKDGARITEATVALAKDPAAAQAKVKKAQEFIAGRQRETVGVLAKALR